MIKGSNKFLVALAFAVCATVAFASNAPTLNAIANPAAIPEDSGPQTVNLSGISDADGDTQTITITASSNNPALIPNPTVTYAGSPAPAATTGTLSYTPVAHQSGTALITVTVTDSGAAPNTATQTFTVTVNPNVQPTLAAIANPAAFPEDSGAHSVTLIGIGAGAGETQALTVTATSGNTTLIPNANLSVTYTSPAATGTINFTAAAHQVGTALITVTVQDNGGTAGGGVDTITQTFTVTISPNAPPTLAAIPNPPAFPEDSGAHSVNVAGIGAGTGETQSLTVTATSGNTTLIPNANISVTYTSPSATGTINFTAAAHQVGTAVITVTVQDNGGTAGGGIDTVTQTFTVTISPNAQPVIAASPNPTFPQDSGAHTFNLSGIGAGAGETQSLTVTATSGNTTLIPSASLSVTYTSPSATATINFTAAAHLVGTSLITVTVQDNGGTAGGGMDTVTQTFTITIAPNTPPTLAAIPNPPAFPEDSGAHSVNLAGIAASASGFESQTLAVTATSGNPTLIPNGNISVTYTSANPTGSVSFAAAPHQVGTALITVSVQDNGGTAGGGVDTFTQSFTVTISPNVQPVISATTGPTFPEDSGAHTVNLTGISAGAGETQALTVTATSANTTLIPNASLSVTYTSPAATATLNFTAATHQVGTSLITVTVQDNGGTAGGGVDTVTQTFTITIAPNAPPTLAAIPNPPAIPEDSAAHSVNLAGIAASASGFETQALTVTATSGNTTLIPNANITVTYASPAAIGSVSFTAAPHQVGTAVITVSVQDNGGTAGGGVDTVTQTFTVTISPNVQPVIAATPNPTFPEDSGAQTVSLTGIGAGAGETQGLTVNATSGNQTLIPNAAIAVTYASPASTATLTFTAAAHQVGTAVISVTVQDNGGTVGGGVDTVTQTFTITISPNVAPVIAAITDPPAIPEDSPSHSVTVSGLGAGLNETQALTLTATSGNTTLIPNANIAITYTSPNPTGTVTFTAAAHQVGTAVITVQVQDNGGTANGGVDTATRTFTVTISPNVPPTLAVIPNPVAIPEESGMQTVNFSGVGPGTGETQTLTVTATSDTPGLIPNPVVTYTTPGATGFLTYTPVAHQTGTATITVSVMDNGGTALGGVDTFTRTFLVTVSPNQAPTLSPIANTTIPEDTVQQTVNLAGIGTGGEANQALTVTATSNNQTLIPDASIAVTYTSPAATGTLKFTAATHQTGTATITVKVQDNGGTANGGQDTFTQSFFVTVSPDKLPTLAAIPDVTVPEDAVMQTVNLSGITTDAGLVEVRQNLTVTATSDNQAVIRNADIGIVYTNPSSTATLTYITVLHATGAANITVKVQDDGTTANGGTDSFTQTFAVTVSPNLPPTLNAISNLTIPEDTVQQTVHLSGIQTDATPVEVRQALTVTASSGNQAVIRDADISVSYTSPGNTATINFISVLHASGVTTITVKVQDDGGTANGGTNTFLQAFNVTVSPDTAPTLDPIANASIPEDNVLQTVVLTGIFTDAIPIETRQLLTVSATSDNQAVIRDADIAVVYNFNSTTATLTYISALHGTGTANITVKVQDDGTTSNNGIDSVTRAFAVTVQPDKVPTLDPIVSQIVAEDSVAHTVNLSGIKTDAAQVEVRQFLTLTAASNNQALVRDQDISITNIKPDFTAQLTYITVLHATGTATVTVTVHDDGGTANGGTNQFSQNFTVTISANQPPLLNAIPDPAPINENASTQTITLAGIKTGANQLETRQVLTITATSDNQVVIPDANITVNYTSPNLGGLVSYIPVAHTNGTANITVKVQDDGDTANGGGDTVTQTFKVVVNQVYEPAIVTDGPRLVNTNPVSARPTAGMLPDYVALTNAPVALTVSVLDYDIDSVLNGLVDNVSTRDTLRFDWSATVGGQPAATAVFTPNHDVPADPVTGSALTKGISVVFTEAGIYTVSLTITGVAGNAATGTDSVTIATLVIPVNTPPVLNSVQLPAGQDPVLSVSEDVTITAYSTVNGDPALTPAFDPDGDALLYSWSFKRLDDVNDEDYVQFATTTVNSVVFNTSDPVFAAAFNGDDQVALRLQCVITDLPARGVNAGYTSTPPSKPTVTYILDGYPPNYRSPEDTRTVVISITNPNNTVKSGLSTVVRNPINKITLFSLGGRGIFQVDARYVQDNQLSFAGDGNPQDDAALTLKLSPDPTQTPLPGGALPSTVGEIESVLNLPYPLVKLLPAPNPDAKFFDIKIVNQPFSNLSRNPFTVTLNSRNDPNNTQAEGVSLINVRDVTQSDPNNAIIARRMIPITTVESQTAEGPTTTPIPGNYDQTFITGRFGFRDGKRDLVPFRGVFSGVTHPNLDTAGGENKISIGLGNIIVEGTFAFKNRGLTAKVKINRVFDDGFHTPLTPKAVSIFRVQLKGDTLLVNLALAADNMAARGFDTAGVTNDGLQRFGVAPPPGYGTVQKGKLTQIFIQSAVVVGQEGKLNNNFDSIVRCFFFVKGGVGRIVGQNFKQ